MDISFFLAFNLLSLGLIIVSLSVILYIQVNFPRKTYMPFIGFNLLGLFVITIEVFILYHMQHNSSLSVLHRYTLIQEYLFCFYFPLIPSLIGNVFELPLWAKNINRWAEIIGQGLVFFFLAFLFLFPKEFLALPENTDLTSYGELILYRHQGLGLWIRDALFFVYIIYLFTIMIFHYKGQSFRRKNETILLWGLILGISFSLIGLMNNYAYSLVWRNLAEHFFVNLGLSVFNLTGMLFFLHFFFHRAHNYEESNLQLEEQKETLYRLAFRDDLTGLPNRKSFIYELEDICQNPTAVYGAYLIDIDHFQDLNESYGYRVGDYMLQSVTRAIRRLIHDVGGKLFRISGDEFGYISPRLLNKQEAMFFADDLKSVFDQSFHYQDSNFFLTVSIGAGVFPVKGSDTPEWIMKCLGVALLEAKQENDRYCFYSSGLKERSKRNVDMISALREGLHKEELLVYYQPIVDTYGKVVFAEALLRWKHPEWGMVSPSAFIPLAETAGLIMPLSDMMIQQVLSDIRQLDKENLPIKFCLNLSAKQLKAPNLCHRVKNYLDSYNIGVDKISFELTETALIENIEESQHLLHCFKNAGFDISIDDFGKGYSSLNYLRILPIEKLKIDKCFVDSLMGDPKDKALISSIIQLAKTMELKVVAEGVERQEQYEFLKQAGCDFFQGYLFSEAVPFDALLKFVR
ncbi:putative bifunctional diguanylate cyclase/phosphodiesterase [Spirochaeta cellobiosiphila]|uniref:putative bifunctional diguanylate cyclase/phosphodiesterase n=1 Tax=Spirochaeta cellobiosiphila TaxID=504483 RepID=UPI000490A935|nr:bifunctional diguanylate cyclase/phosphodiesterase [Spirochaeta cellobiosiphila]